MTAPATNVAEVRVRNGPLADAVLGRVVGMLAARADCPIDRLDEALLLTDALTAHTPAGVAHLRVVVATEPGRLELRVADLPADGARALIAAATLPGVGNVFERVAHEVSAVTGSDGDELLVLALRF
jgi:hypothetical protein